MIRLCLIFIAFASNCFAATHIVRGGEHDDRTRLVIPFAQSSIPTVEHNAKARSVSISDLTAEPDVSQAFTRIARDRVANISADNTTLTVSLACDCRVEWYVSPENALVVDVFSPDFPLRPIKRPSNIEPSGATTPTLNIPWYSAQSAAPVQMDPPRNTAVENIRSQVFDALSNSVNAIPNHLIEEPVATTAETIGLDVHSPFEPNATPSRSNLPGFTCPKQDSTNPATWSIGTPFKSALASTERSLGSADIPEERAELTLKLARVYLAHGFGTEASHVLAPQSGVPQSPEMRQLRKIADLVDEKESPSLTQYIGCSGSSSIWAVLAGANPNDLSQSQKQDLTRAFANFPSALQSRIHTRLIARFDTSGDHQIATVLAAFSGEPIVPSHHNSTADSTPVGSYLGTKVADITPSEFANLLDTAIAAEDPVPDTIIRFSETLRYELEGAPEAELVSIARLNALLAQSDFSAAHEVLTAELAGPQADEAIRRHYLSEVTKNAPDNRFLDDAFSFAPEGYDSDLRNSIADRLRESGFIERANLWAGIGAAESIPPALDVARRSNVATDRGNSSSDAQLSLDELRGQLNAAEALRNSGLALLN